jgi:hypothetical protein
MPLSLPPPPPHTAAQRKSKQNFKIPKLADDDYYNSIIILTFIYIFEIYC